MASTNDANNTTPLHDLENNHEKSAQPEPDISGDTEKGPEGSQESFPGDKPDDRDVTKSEDAGPPDGGSAAWLVILGAWCCSFSAPGWINSTCYDLLLYDAFKPLCFSCEVSSGHVID